MVTPSMVMVGGIGTFYALTFVFFKLIVSPKCLHASENLSRNLCSPCSECATRAASSTNSISLIKTVLSLVFERRQARLCSFLSDLVCRYTPSVDVSKANDRRSEKKIPKRAGAKTQPCLTPLQMGKESENDPSNNTVPSCRHGRR